MSKIFELPAYGWCPRKDQMPIWNAMMRPDFRRGNIVAHRRWGKDELALQCLSVKAMERVGSYFYALPEYEQARKAIWTMVNWRTKRTRIDDAFPPEIVAKRDDDAMFLKLDSGSTIQLVGSDRVDSLVGGGQIGIIMSEAALSNPKAVDFFRPILEESGGWELQISTPRGKNFFYREHLAATEDMRSGDPTVFAAYLPADKTNVFSFDQLARIKMDYVRKHGKALGEALFNQEYGCSFNAAVIGAVWPEETSHLELEGRVRPIPHDRRFPVTTSWDIGVSVTDPTVILFWQEIHGRHRLIDAHEGYQIGLETYVALLKHKHQELGYNYGLHLGPHDIQNREWLRGVQRIDEAKRLGLHFKRVPNTRVKTQISAAAQMLRMVEVNENNVDAMAAFDHWKQYSFPESKTGVVITTPKHDEHSHASSAMMTYSVYHASKLGVVVGDGDPSLHSNTDALGGGQKFDPRRFGDAPYGGEHSVSAMMRGTPNYGGKPRGGAFG